MASVNVDSDFGDTDISGRGYGVMLASIICPSIALLFVAARWYVRVCITKKLRMDDYIAVFALASNITYSVLQGLATRPQIGVGQHLDTFPQTEESPYYMWVYLFDGFYIISLLGYKSCILFLYLRVFGVRKHFRWTCYAVLFLVAGYLLASLGVQWGGCNPPHKFWDKYVDGTCIDYKRFDIAYGCLNVITDFIITVLPLREIWRLFMPIKEKFWASLIFGSAFLALGTAIVSQVYRFNDLLQSTDRTYAASVTFVWQTIEINTGLICSCTPSLRPLFRQTVDRLTATFGTRSSGSQAETLVQGRVERELAGEKMDDEETSPGTSPDGTHERDPEKGAASAASGARKAQGRPSTERKDPDASARRHVPSDVYMSPLPSLTAAEAAHTRAEVDRHDTLRSLNSPEAFARGRALEKKRLSQAELEAMVIAANEAQRRLEQQAERSRHRHERDSETLTGTLAGPIESVPMLLPVHNSETERVEATDVGTLGTMDSSSAAHSLHSHVHDPMPESLSREAGKQARKKKSCDLEKGVGLRI